MLYPFVDKQGRFTEEEVDPSVKTFRRVKTVKSRLVLSVNDPVAAPETPTELFTKHHATFGVNDGANRITTSVFVSEELTKGVPQLERNKRIQLFIQAAAPWVFSYGVREVVSVPPDKQSS